MAVAAAGCGGDFESRYAEGVADYEPIYCYRNIGDVSCYKRPDFRDERQLVNFYGPSPRRYERPAPPPKPVLEPPPPADFFVRDAEPVPMPDERPWLEPEERPGMPPAAVSRVDVFRPRYAPAEDESVPAAAESPDTPMP